MFVSFPFFDIGKSVKLKQFKSVLKQKDMLSTPKKPWTNLLEE
jgi:hypothetical protein